MGRHWVVRLIAVIVVGAAISGCGSSSSSHSRSTGHDAALGPRLFCNQRAQREISTSLGIKPTRVTKPSSRGHRYSCRYLYPEGAIALSVTGFLDPTSARTYADRLGRRRGRRPEPPQLGEGLDAFVTSDGSMIVRNHRDVLEVDVAALPPRFGDPPQTTSVVSLAVAVTILGHWVPG